MGSSLGVSNMFDPHVFDAKYHILCPLGMGVSLLLFKQAQIASNPCEAF